MATQPLPPVALEELKAAKRVLEADRLTTRLSQYVGTPIERTFDRLPNFITERIDRAIQTALQQTTEIAVRSLDIDDRLQTHRWPLSNYRRHQIAAAGAGFIGGAFGVIGFTLELPVSTLLILRLIADVARAEGEDFNDPEARLACIEVFAYGGPGSHDDGVDTGYLVMRQSLAAILSRSSTTWAPGMRSVGGRALQAFVATIATRFSNAATRKFAAQSVPLLGAIGGAGINALFAHHYQSVAKAHFTVRRLERCYGRDKVQQQYRDLV